MHDTRPLTPILVSACLLGLPTRYDGQSKRSQAVFDYLQREGLTPVPVCPEQLAGMTTPRDRVFFAAGDGQAVLDGCGSVMSACGQAMNALFCRGAALSLQVARLAGCRSALLKEHSPSCGVHEIDRNGERVAGAGVTAAMLIREGLNVFSERDL